MAEDMHPERGFIGRCVDRFKDISAEQRRASSLRAIIWADLKIFFAPEMIPISEIRNLIGKLLQKKQKF